MSGLVVGTNDRARARTAGTDSVGVSAQRDVSLDRVRGLAVLAMLVDHLCVIFSGPLLLRGTVGRVAVPLFFVTAGQCSGRLRWRHARVLGYGLALPVVAWWIDDPNVLVMWAVGCVLLAGFRWAEVHPAWLTVAGLTWAVNGYTLDGGNFYDPALLWALMGLGASLPRSFWSWGHALPAWVGWIGRHALGFYLFHVLALTGVALVMW